MIKLNQKKITTQGKFLKKMVLGVSAMSLLTTPAFAKDINEILNLPDNVFVGGRLTQGTGVYFDQSGDNSIGWGPSQFIAEIEAEWTPTSNIAVNANFWLRGDWFYDLDNGNFKTQGVQDFTSPQSAFLDRFDFLVSENGSLTLPQPFGNDGKENRFLDDFDDDIIRELSVSITNDSGSINLIAGKFQRGWGQADGLRLLDILNAQDLRQRSVFSDTEDIRIPAWTAALSLDLKALNLDAPLQAIGLKNSSLELVYIPEVRHTQFVINNPTPSKPTSGGPFGFPYPRLIETETGFGTPLLTSRLNDVGVEDWKNQEIAARLKFEAFGGQATVNGFIGYQDLPLLINTGSTLHIGTFINDPAAAIANVPLDLATTIGAVHGPGQYVDFIQSLATGTAAPGDFPLIPFGCLDILNPAAGGQPCSITIDFDLDYTARQKTAGFSFTRDMTGLKFGRKQVSPVLRVESTYEFNKSFNRQTIDDPFNAGETVSGTPAFIGTRSDIIAQRDQISTMVGFDFNFWVPGWESQRSSIFMTSQFFNIHTKDHEGLLFQAPYALLDVEKNQQYFTQTYGIGLFNDNVNVNGLAIWDISKGGYAYRQRFDFTALNNKVRPRIEIGFFGGGTEAGLLGLYKQSDYVEFSLTYQF